MASSRTPRAPRVVLQITDALIQEAVPRDSSHCLWAEAVKAAYPDASGIAVDLQTIRFSDLKKGFRFTYLTPRVAQVALIDFDQGTLPAPHSVRLGNGQVTRAGSRWRTKSTKKLSNPQMKQKAEAAKIGRDTLSQARLSSANPGTGIVPDRIGGKTPPTTSFAKRRAFGLRALSR